MPDFESHLRQAERNERVASHLATFPDWQTVALFYAALHYVDAYLAQRFGAQGHPTSHQARLRFLARDPALTGVYQQYRELLDRSQDARYNALDVPEASAQELMREQFALVRSRIRTLLNLPP